MYNYVSSLKEEKTCFLNCAAERQVLLAESDLVHRMRYYLTDIITRADCFLIVMFTVTLMPNYAVFLNNILNCCEASIQQMAMLLLLHLCFDIYPVPFFLLVEDLERNDGSAEKPYYMSQSLMKIMNRRNVETKKQ